jgi:hypothetical protein
MCDNWSQKIAGMSRELPCKTYYLGHIAQAPRVRREVEAWWGFARHGLCQFGRQTRDPGSGSARA